MRLAILDFGTLDIALGALLPGEGSGEWMTIGVPGYVIETDAGERILVDTGMPPAYIADPAGAAKRDGYDAWVRSNATDTNTPTVQLALLGLSAGDITHVIVTHTHFDHAGNLDAFPDALHVIQRAERELPTPVYAQLSWPTNVRWHVVDGDTEFLPGIRFLFTPGHTPGHMSIELALPRTGPVLLAIDAIYLPLSLARDNFKASWNEGLARASGHRIAQRAEETGALLIFGHDPAQWGTLRKAPAWYE